MKVYASSRLIGERDIPSAIRLLAQMGYDGIEIWHEDIATASTWELREISGLGMPITVHGASQDINICSSNPRIADASLGEIRRSIDIAQQLVANAVVIHPGHLSSSKDDPRPKWEELLNVLRRLSEYASLRNVSLLVENMEARPRELLVTDDDIRRLFAPLKEHRVGLCLDIAHAATVKDVGAFLSSDILCYVAEYHISNSSAGSVHLPLWQGSEHMVAALRGILRNFPGPVVVEGVDKMEDPALLLSRNMKKLAEWDLAGGTA